MLKYQYNIYRDGSCSVFCAAGLYSPLHTHVIVHAVYTGLYSIW